MDRVVPVPPSPRPDLDSVIELVELVVVDFAVVAPALHHDAPGDVTGNLLSPRIVLFTNGITAARKPARENMIWSFRLQVLLASNYILPARRSVE